MPQADGPQIDAYILDLFVREDDAQCAALESARAAGLPGIQVPAALGKLLHILTRTVQAKKILEIGTLGGYSGIWMARALPTGGRLISLEIDPHHAEVARRNFAKAGVEDHVEVRLGPALETLETLSAESPFDLVYIDADKDNYPAYLDWAMRLTRSGSLIVADNVLRGGQAINAEAQDAGAQGIRDFNRRAADDPRLDAIILPNRDGHDGILVAVVK